MKKTIIAAILAAATFLPTTLRAEDTEYNMVITLQNGTTITLGHNDIKNITFNGEEISISGNVVNTIDSIATAGADVVANLHEIENYLNMIENKSLNMECRIAENESIMHGMYDELRTMINDIVTIISANQNDIIENRNRIYQLTEELENLKAFVSDLSNRVQ